MTSSLKAIERERKFYITLLVILLATLLRAFDRVTDAVYGDVLIYTVGLFMAGNSLEHGAAAWRDRTNGKAP